MATTGNIFLVVSLWCSHICKEKTLKGRRRALFFCLDVPTYSSTSSDVRTRRWHDPPSLFFLLCPIHIYVRESRDEIAWLSFFRL